MTRMTCERCGKRMRSVQWAPSGEYVADYFAEVGKRTRSPGEFDQEMCDECEEEMFEASEEYEAVKEKSEKVSETS